MRRSEGVGLSKPDNHETIQVSPKVWSKGESSPPETYYRCRSGLASRVVCHTISEENGIPDPVGTASHTSGSDGGSLEF